jgi:hypothetical protein
LQNAKEGWIPTFIIILDYNTFVHCFLQLNKQRYAFVCCLVAGFLKAAVSTLEIYIA